jgi:hypothetical protein
MTASIEHLSKDADEVLEHLRALPVTTREQYAFAAEVVRDVATTLAEVEAERVKITKPQYEAWRATNDLFSRVRKRYEEGDAILREKMETYLAEEKARERLLLQEVASGNVEALAVMGEASPTVDGISERKKVSFEVVDEALVPDEYWVLDEKAIRAAVKSGVKIPGVKTINGTSLAVSKRK